MGKVNLDVGSTSRTAAAAEAATNAAAAAATGVDAADASPLPPPHAAPADLLIFAESGVVAATVAREHVAVLLLRG